MTCPRCEFVKELFNHKNRYLYHLKWHSRVSDLWWTPLFYYGAIKQFVTWIALRDYYGNWEAFSWQRLRDDWQFAVEFQQSIWS